MHVNDDRIDSSKPPNAEDPTVPGLITISRES